MAKNQQPDPKQGSIGHGGTVAPPGTNKQFPTKHGSIRYWISRADNAKATVVFLPGLTADHRLFELQTAYFCNHYNTLVWDPPGHGISRPFALDFTLMDQAQWLYEILQLEAVTAPFLVGQSMGGYVAQCLISRYPKSVGGFVSIDSAPLQRKYTTTLEIWGLKHCEPIYRLFSWNALLASGTTGCAQTQYGQTLMNAMMNEYDKESYCALAGHGSRMLGEAMAADLPYTIDCPALLLCGELDGAGSAKRYNRRWAKDTGFPLVWIENAGHNANADDPRTVNRLIEQFIGQVLQSQAVQN